jgi:hypothetical protein
MNGASLPPRPNMRQVPGGLIHNHKIQMGIEGPA